MVCVRCVSLITNRLCFKQNVFSSAVCGKCTCHRVDSPLYAVFTNAHIQGDVFHPVEEENGDPTVGVSPHELYAAESRRIFTPLFPECNPFNVRNNRDTFLEVGEKL